MEEKKSKINRLLISLLMVIVLFVLPAGSWFYLQKGLDYHKNALSELQELGKVQDFQLQNQNNLPVSPEAVSGRISVVNFLPSDKQKAKALTERIAKVHQSFNDTEDVVFLSVIQADSTDKLLDLATDLGIKDHNQWFLLGATTEEWQRLAKEVYFVPDGENSIALVDTSLTIRKYYDIRKNEEMGRLVEHIALIVPKQKRR